MHQLIDGKATAAAIRQEIAAEVEKLLAAGQRRPHLAAVLVGNDGGSETYVANKIKACEDAGFTSTLLRFDSNISEAALLAEVAKLNADEQIDGFIVQLPLPGHINAEKVNESIDPRKDVDGFHAVNIGRMVLNLPCYLPATPHGIIELLKRYNINTQGKHCVVLGRSHIVGSPVSILLARNTQPGNCTVTLCHSRTAHLKEHLLQADIIVAALGKPEFVKADMVKEGAIVIDVGTTRVSDSSRKSGFRLAGDVDFEQVAPKCSYITPVPGGVGPMTIAMLLKNTLHAAKKDFYG
ncbi:MAG: bifunctional 5,10-methylene-tetrahydrofolate dehydrogenase/5,10-methylene-tetrahydrofolate cyclohydrolase [Sphingobacteriaceae bacterium]|nr:bifunctional 5,10-methylene-tetrahydrofolate dehydrogenase/5,10-methylene-tetrahydrofolate cyclohydrolase [Sphingobacteriaceae bacterium]